ncbi:hypothetical protein THAOC_36887, partial [Thalassiosira oceanica]
MRKRNLIFDSLFVFLWRNYFGLLRPFLPDNLFEGREDEDPIGIEMSSIHLSHEIKRSVMLDCLRKLDIFPYWHTPTFLSNENELRQCSTDDEIEKTLMAIDANVYARWDFVDDMTKYWIDMPGSREARLKKFIKDLDHKKVKAILELIDDHRINSDNHDFDCFKSAIVTLIGSAAEVIPVFRSYIQFSDLDPAFKKKDWMDSTARTNMLAKLCQNIVKLVGGVDFQTNQPIDAASTAAMSSIDLDHLEKEGKEGVNPSDIAKKGDGAVRLGKAVAEHRLVPVGGNHHRGDDPHPCRGDDDPMKRMEEGQKDKNSHIVDLPPFLAEMEWIGAFSEAKWVPHKFTTLQVLFFVYFGRNAESFYMTNPFWYNGCKGNKNPNYFGKVVNRSRANIQAIINLLKSLCEWDPDFNLKDEHAALFHLCPREMCGVDND